MSRFLLVLILVGTLFSGCDCNSEPGNGEKIGQVVKLSRQGVVSKTWEGQLIRGGLSGGSGAVGGAPFNFTVENEEMANKVQGFMKSQTEVLIKYRTEFVYAKYRSSSGGDFLESIEPAKVNSETGTK